MKILKVLNIVLFFLIIAALAYVFTHPAHYSALEIKTETRIEQPRDYEIFLKDVSTRKVFAAPVVSAVVSVNPAAVDELKILRDNLRLCGVIESNGLKAIIEDKQAGKSSCVSAGGVVAQGATVKAINKDSVTLTYAGADFDLHL